MQPVSASLQSPVFSASNRRGRDPTSPFCSQDRSPDNRFFQSNSCSDDHTGWRPDPVTKESYRWSWENDWMTLSVVLFCALSQMIVVCFDQVSQLIKCHKSPGWFKYCMHSIQITLNWHRIWCPNLKCHRSHWRLVNTTAQQMSNESRPSNDITGDG